MRDRLARSFGVALFVLVASVNLVSLSPASADTADTSVPGPVHGKAVGATPEHAGRQVVGLASTIADADPLPSSPFGGTLHEQGGSDLFAVPVSAGSRIEFTLADADGTFDLYLFGPATTSLADAIAVAHASSGGYPRRLAFDVPTTVTGTYYLEVYAWSGSGDYSMSWRVIPVDDRARRDVDSAQSVVLPRDLTFSIADELQANAVYSFAVSGGRRLRVDLAGPAGADFDLHLYAPGTASILPVETRPLLSANGPSSTETLVYDVPPGAGGTYVLEVIRFSGSGSADMAIRSSAMPTTPATRRVAGADRYATAVAISKESFPAGSRSVVLCSGRSFPDGLAAAALAGAVDGPVLLSAPETLPDGVGLELQRLRADTIYIVGGAKAVGYDAERRVGLFRPGARIFRVAGATRYETAAEVADEVHEVLGIRPGMLFLASGESFPDALALSPVAYSTHTPIILTAKTSLPEASRAAIVRMRGSAARTVDLVAAGGEAALSHSVLSAATSAAGGAAERAAGSDRYETALAVAELAISRSWAEPGAVAVASGVNFPDALGGSPLPGARGGVLLLCPGSALGTHSMSFLKSFDFAIGSCWALGGDRVVTPGVVGEIDAILPDTAPW